MSLDYSTQYPFNSILIAHLVFSLVAPPDKIVGTRLCVLSALKSQQVTMVRAGYVISFFTGAPFRFVFAVVIFSRDKLDRFSQEENKE